MGEANPRRTQPKLVRGPEGARGGVRRREHPGQRASCVCLEGDQGKAGHRDRRAGRGGWSHGPWETGVHEDEERETPGMMEAGTWGVPWDC